MAEKKKKEPNEKKEYRSFLYMLPVEAGAGKLAEALPFLERKSVEIWTEINLLEITLAGGTLTFEDMMPELCGKEDEQLLADMGVKQVYACDYEAKDAKEVQAIMKALTESFGGFLASDTADFKPFLEAGEL